MSAAQQLHEAIKSGDASQVRALVERDPSLLGGGGAAGLAPLMFAVYCGRREVAECLIEQGAEVDVFSAAALGDVARLQDWLKRDQSLLQARSSDGWTPLHLAAFFGQKQAVEYLREQGADIEARSANNMRNTALIAAAAGGRVDVVAALLASGAEVDARQTGDYTALHSAAAAGNEEMARLLLNHGADPSAKSEQGETPTDMAREKGHHQMVRLLESAAR